MAAYQLIVINQAGLYNLVICQQQQWQWALGCLLLS